MSGAGIATTATGGDGTNLDPLEATNLDPGMGLCLSGGGFRAMVFHLGALWRLNEMGLLAQIKRFSSVSGGSITNGVLANAWPKLSFVSGVADNFETLVAKPILSFARRRIDIGAVLVGMLPTQSAAHRVAHAYDDGLFHGRLLRDLPLQPRFTFNATNLMTGGLFRMSAAYAADYRVGRIDTPPFRLADVVAASSAFPPVLSPLELDLKPVVVQDMPGTSLHRAPFTEKVVLTDGGVYDNLGLETVWKRFRTILVSNAGRNVFPDESPAHSWPLQLDRVVEVILNQVDNARERQLLALAHAQQRTVGYWAIQTDPTGFHATPGTAVLTAAELARSAQITTRLSTLSADDCALLVKHAYLLSDLAVRSYVAPGLPPPAHIPDIGALMP